ncbi:MAG: hypothetical protein JST89_03825 [Cyanobacteria bacterium SZAS-4]|nr:hypothetical protein [Cyanobacteria bacterium SZAS-4]
MKKSRNLLLISLLVAFLLASIALSSCAPSHNSVPAPESSTIQTGQSTTHATGGLEDHFKSENGLLEDAFTGTMKPVDEDDSNLKVGEVPLSKFHSAAAKEFELGNRLAEGKNWGEAHSHYIKCMNEMHKDQQTRVVILDENWFSVCYGVISVCLAEQNQLAAAVSHLDEAIRLDRGIKENYILRGNLYRRLHKSQEAEADYKIASSKSVLQCYPAWAHKSSWCHFPASAAATK